MPSSELGLVTPSCKGGGVKGVGHPAGILSVGPESWSWMLAKSAGCQNDVGTPPGEKPQSVPKPYGLSALGDGRHELIESRDPEVWWTL